MKLRVGSIMKIAVSGAHGTGKTTICEHMLSRLSESHDLAICREVPRVIIDAVGDPHFFRRKNNTVERQFLIFLFQLEEERKQGEGRAILLCDRTPVDHLAYMLVNHPEFSKTPEFDALSRLIAPWLSTFDAIFKVPIEFELIDDGVREGAQKFQSSIDQKIDLLFDRFEVNPIIVTGSVEERF